ncbi:MAG: long-chain fatty acid--CoA ligase [Longimicrobiales bacterium]|nr:long-chain fatty acid--CoA ligase [Longimicrobiales bacterium]
MSMRTYAADERPVTLKTLTQIFFEAVDAHGERDSFGRILPSKEVEYLSFRGVVAQARKVAGGLEAKGIVRGDRVAIMSPNRLEWALADYGCLCSGVVDVPIYPTLTAQQVSYILRDSGARLMFVPDADHVVKALEAIATCGRSVDVVVFDPPPELPGGVVAWSDFLAEGSRKAAAESDLGFRARALETKPEDVATILYTSGTTGDPKGVMLTHGNVGSNVEAARMVLLISARDVTVSFLPLSHILQRMVDYLFFHQGVTIVHARSMLTAIEDMALVRPTVAVAVPRVYEKIHAAVMNATGLKKRVITWAVGVADRTVELRLAGGAPKGVLALQYRLADRLVFGKVRAAVGGRLRFFVSGSAPLSPELGRFFYSIGLTILEGYGLTETSPVTNVNTEEHFRIGTVGKAVPSTEIRIAEDGEILVRGPQVMKGYHNRPDDTAQAIDPDGWFHTGDIGELDADGFLRITDRKKDLIVTAGGKNVAPQPIENRLKANPFVEQAVLIGDRRRFISVLVVPAFDRLEAWARGEGIAWADRRDLLANAAVQRHMEGEVARELRGLASFEAPKKVALLEEDFTIANGVLTPTLKVKRKVIQDRFRDLVEELYREDSTGTRHR